MRSAKTSIFAVALLAGASLATPTFAVEPDVDSPEGPELPAPRPDFQFDDQAGAPRERDIEGTELGAGAEMMIPEEEDALTVPPPALPEY